MITQPCAPLYDYRPEDFEAGPTKCIAPLIAERRSRLFEGNTFFRSKEQGPDKNSIALECTSGEFRVYVNDTVVEQYPIAVGPGGISALRSQVVANVSSIIEMPALNADVNDVRAEEDDDIIGLLTFNKTFMTGGSGGPTTRAGLATIRTGPERSIFIVSTTEDESGTDVSPDLAKRIRQWNGTQWISYCNTIQGSCPKEGTC